MFGFEHNTDQSLTSVLERLKQTVSSLNSAVTANFSIQQNQADGLRKIGVIFPAAAPNSTSNGVNAGSVPEPANIVDALSRELDKFNYLNNLLEKQIEDAKFIDKALFNQTVLPEPKATQGAMQATSAGDSLRH